MGLGDFPLTWLAQGLGMIAFVISVSRYQMRDKRAMMRANGFASLIFSLHYFILGGFVGLAMAAAAGSRSLILSTETGQKYKWFIIPPILLCASAIAIITRENYFVLFVLVGPYLVASAEMLGCDFRLRKMSILSDACWLAYALMTGSFGAALSTASGIFSGAVGIMRFNLPGFTFSRLITAKI